MSPAEALLHLRTRLQAEADSHAIDRIHCSDHDRQFDQILFSERV